MTYTTRETCRVCGSSDLTFLFSLGDQAVSDFPRPGEDQEREKIPIELELCNNCTLVQAKHTAPQEFLYTRHYWYRSGVTDTMRKALREVASTIENIVSLKPGDVVLDIGSNDGTLLRSYTLDGLRLVGVEPAINLADEGRVGLDEFLNMFWNYTDYDACIGESAKVITALGMFYDLEDPNQFIADISKALSPDGIFISQLMCLQNMLDLGDVGNFAHEHLEFYSLKSLKYLYEKHGLQIIDIETNNVNGKSYRIYACRKSSFFAPNCKPGWEQRLDVVQAREQRLSDLWPFRNFLDRLEANKKKVIEFIEDVVAEGKTVWVYGASTKGNVILQYYGLDYRLIQGAADRSPEKVGRVTVSTNIPIFSEEYAREANPDYFLVLPYAFIDEFVDREREYLTKGGHFIVPLPEMRII